MAKKKKGPKWVRNANGWTAVIAQSSEDMARARYGARRDAEKEAGTLVLRGRGGAFGISQKQKQRLDRTRSKTALRQGRFDD